MYNCPSWFLSEQENLKMTSQDQKLNTYELVYI